MGRCAMRRMAVGFGLLVVVVGTMARTSSAEAQDGALDFGGTVIVGQVLTPEVLVFISRENLTKDYNIVLEESFLHRISESLERPPF